MRYADPEAQAEIDRLKAKNAELRAKVEKQRAKLNCTCGLLRASYTRRTTHDMMCREYVGPIEHRWVSSRVNPSFGGIDHYCLCGGWFRRGGIAGHGDGSETAEPICPKADETWRGPKPEAQQ